MFLFFHFQSNNTNEDPVTPPRDNSIHDDNGCHSSTKRKSTGRTRRQSRRSMMKRRSSVALIDFSQPAEVSLSLSSSSPSYGRLTFIFTYLSLPCSILITVTTPKPHPQQYPTMALTSLLPSLTSLSPPLPNHHNHHHLKMYQLPISSTSIMLILSSRVQENGSPMVWQPPLKMGTPGGHRCIVLHL